MNWKTILVLFILAAAAVYGVFQLQSQQQTEATAATEQARLYPQLAEKIDAVDQIRVVGAEDKPLVELQRQDTGWVLASRHNYPLALDTLRELLNTLASAEIIETKTSNPERYTALNVEDVSAADAGGVRLDLEGSAEPISLIIGKNAERSFDQTYVRKAGTEQSLLVSGALSPAQEIQRWAEQPIVEIPAEQVQRVVIRHPDGEQLTVLKNSRADTNFKLFNLLEGRELSHDTVANPIGNALSNLRLEDLSTVELMNPNEADPIVAEYYLFDGRKIMVQTFQQNDKYYAHLRADFDAEQQQRFQPTEPEASTAEDTPGESTDEASTSEAPAQLAASLDDKLKPWVFEISQYKHESMSKRLDDLLKPLPEAAESATDTGAAAQPTTAPAQ